VRSDMSDKPNSRSGVGFHRRLFINTPAESMGSPASGQRVIVWLRLMLLVSALLPFAFLAAYALITYQLALDDLEHLVQRTADVLQEHTLKVFETQELILDQVSNLLQGRNPNELTERSDLNEALKNLQRDRRQIAGIFIFDAKGDLRAGSTWRPGLSGSDRDYFQYIEAHPGQKATFVGKAVTGRVTGRPGFGFSRPWPAPDGVFFGVIGISISADYFTDFFYNAARDIKHRASLIRTGKCWRAIRRGRRRHRYLRRIR
jgi:two-component system, NtrC family, sensor kinase